jgi:S-adenosylmethionine synthetase
MDRSYLFTSESVSEGHPDKIADQISDAILDAFLAREATAKVACETLVADNLVVIAGEFRTADPAIYEDIRDRAEGIARQVLRDAGYREADTGIDPDSAAKCRCASTTSRSRSTRASSMPTA